MALVLIVVSALVWYVARRLFLLDQVDRKGQHGIVTNVPCTAARTRVMLIGPPGTGKTARLTEMCGPIFDVQTGDYVERRNETLDERPLGIDHFEYGLDDPSCRPRLLCFLEELTYRDHRRVWIATAREPLAYLQELQERRASDCPTGKKRRASVADLERWTAAWEREGVKVSWATLQTTILTVACTLAGLLILTQEQLVGAWIAYVPTLAPVVPIALRFVSSARSNGKPESELA